MKTKSVWLTIGHFVCRDCDHEFDTPCMCAAGEAASLWYGEFLFYARDGSMVYWNSLNHPIYDAFEKKRDAILKQRPDFPKYGLIPLGFLVDPPADGSHYDNNAYCPLCKGNNIAYQKQQEGSVTLRIPCATFTRWNALTEAQQHDAILEELEKAKRKKQGN